MSDAEPIIFRPRQPGDQVGRPQPPRGALAPGAPEPGPRTAFDRRELSIIMAVYGRKVAEGLWRDYAIDMLCEKAVFSIFRRTSEVPLYRVEKDPKLARKQGAYSIVAAGGLILKRGHDLERVLSVLDKRIGVVSS